MKMIIKIIKRILGDIIGSFELIFLILTKKDCGMASFILAPVVLPFSVIWCVLKIFWRILSSPFRQKYPIAKIFGIYMVVTTILTIALGLFFPSLFHGLQKFEPINTDGFGTAAQRVSAIFAGGASSLFNRDADILGVLLMFCSFILCGIMSIFTFAATQVPLFAYIWTLLFIGMLIGFVLDIITEGWDSALGEALVEIWESDIKFGLWVTVDTCFEFPVNLVLYSVPGLNVIVYRYRMAKDIRCHSYPPVFRGRVDKSMLDSMHNPIYSRFIK